MPMQYAPLKRLIDVVLSAAALVVLSPVLATVSVMVRVQMGSPILFSQTRPGLNAKLFTLRKFRTMTDARAADGTLLPDDQRLTRFGAFLRSTSLDELPELVNVLRGDMSLVGPRPLHVRYLERYSPTQARRHEVRPGITGLAQVNGRNALNWDDRFAMDVAYVDTMNLRQDVTILLATLKAVVVREGISAEDHATMPEFMGS